MNSEPAVVKISPTGYGQIFFNIIFFAVFWSWMLPWKIVAGAVTCIFVIWTIMNSHKDKTVKIDKENDTISFPSINTYSLWKSIFGLFIPLYGTMYRTENKLSDLKKYCCCQKGNTYFVELYFAGNMVNILRISNENECQSLCDALRDAKPDLYFDEFPSNRVNHAASRRRDIIILGLILCSGIISPYDMVTEKIARHMWSDSTFTMFFDQKDWEFVSVENIEKSKDHYFVTVKLKKDDRIESVRVRMLGYMPDHASPDLERFSVLRTSESWLRDLLKNNKSFEKIKILDYKVVHLDGNIYIGAAKITRDDKNHKMVYLSIENQGKNIKMHILNAHDFLM